MTDVAARELRNDTSGLIKRAQAGERIVITVNGRPAAQLVPLPTPGARRWLPRGELISRSGTRQADAGLRDDLARLARDTTDDPPPLA